MVSPLRYVRPPRDAEAIAERALERILDREGVALAAAVVGPAGVLIDAVGATARAPLIIGRHENCDLRVPDPSVALRQCALLRANQGLTHVWDLRTDLPLVTAEGNKASALRAQGSFTLSFGGYALVVRTQQRERSEFSLLERWREVAKGFDREEATVSITRVQPLGYAGEASGADPVVATLEARLQGQKALTRIPVTLGDFRSGFLIGRYARCALQASGLCELSRVHVLLAEVDGQPTALDLASTNGTFVNGVPICASAIGVHDVLRCASMEIRWTDAGRSGAAV